MTILWVWRRQSELSGNRNAAKLSRLVWNGMSLFHVPAISREIFILVYRQFVSLDFIILPLTSSWKSGSFHSFTKLGGLIDWLTSGCVARDAEMSTFDGEIREIPGISVDQFDNAGQKFYFLSHCHTDHMRGLFCLSTDAPLYATPITALIVSRKFPHLEANLRVLEIGAATSVEVTQTEPASSLHFTVTAIPAGHCPGSCMFVFQTETCNVLYTGDFRMALKDIKKIKLLNEIRDHGNLIVYLDSTFMRLTFPNFPSQTQSVMTILDIVGTFIKKSRTHKGEPF